MKKIEMAFSLSENPCSALHGVKVDKIMQDYSKDELVVLYQSDQQKLIDWVKG